jgi:hypothetical protein
MFLIELVRIKFGLALNLTDVQPRQSRMNKLAYPKTYMALQSEFQKIVDPKFHALKFKYMVGQKNFFYQKWKNWHAIG